MSRRPTAAILCAAPVLPSAHRLSPAPLPRARRYKLRPEERAVYLSRLLVRKDGTFHQQIMQVPEDLLSTEFKKGLGSEAGADAFSEDEEEEGEEGGASGSGSGRSIGGSGARPRMMPRNLGKLLQREGLMLTRSAAK